MGEGDPEVRGEGEEGVSQVGLELPPEGLGQPQLLQQLLALQREEVRGRDDADYVPRLEPWDDEVDEVGDEESEYRDKYALAEVGAADPARKSERRS